MAPEFTVFTSVHNRAHTLPRVYESLRRQTFRDFEWIIVDNESLDNTRDLVRQWEAQSPFPIRYFWQKDGHRKRAYNRAAREAVGEFFVALDSDDEACPDALKIFHEQWNDIPVALRKTFAGVTGLCARTDGKVVGSMFPADVFDCDSVSMFYQHALDGEKWGMARTEVVREYPFPDYIAGYVPEGIVHSAMARKYKSRFVNKIVRIYHVSSDSQSTKNTVDFEDHAEGISLGYRDQLCNDWKFFRFKPLYGFLVAAEYHAWSMFLRGKPRHPLHGLVPRVLASLAWPAGMLLYRRRLNRQRARR